MARQGKKNKLFKDGIANAFVKEIDAPQAAVSGVSHIEINSNNEAIIQGCQGVLEYGENCVRLNLGKRSVVFRGTELEMKSFSVEEVIIEGQFASIEFG